jgi:hypothetical protein
MDEDEILQRVVDRYDPEELIAALGVGTEELVVAFKQRILKGHKNGTLDV